MRDNKVKYGLRNVHYAVFDPETNEYETPKPLKGAISMSLTARNYSKILAADDIEYWRANGNSGYDGDLNFALIPDDFREECLNEQVDTADNVRYETAELNTARFALLFEFQGDVKATRHVLYNCGATRPALAGQTITPRDGPDPSQNTETVTIDAAPRNDLLIKARTGASTTANVYNNWFSSVWTPAV